MGRRTKYALARKKALKDDKGRIILESLPLKYREKHLRRQKSVREYYKKFKIRSFDPKIYLHKWYPWCYCNYEIRLIPQGWYNVKAAKKLYLKFYGKDALNHIKFIKGREALERGWELSDRHKRLYIGGRWLPVRAKVFRTSQYQVGRYRRKIKKQMDTKSNPDSKEAMLIEEVKYLNYGQKPTVSTDKPKKTSRVPNVQKIEQQKKKYLYEE